MAGARIQVCLLMACAAALPGQPALAIPDWLEPYPGATPQTHNFSTFVDSNYKTTAEPSGVVEHYRTLFTAAGLPFFPQKDPIGTTIHGDTPACDLKIDIRKFAGATVVHVTCSQPRLREAEEKAMRNMAKYDQPVYPQPRPPMPALAWPAWLVRCDGAALAAHKGVDRFRLNYLLAEYDCAADRQQIVDFYAEMLQANGYTVTLKTATILPLDRAGAVEGVRYTGAKPGPRFTIRAEIAPIDGAFHVSVRITAHP